jgi:hypothetical protein
MKKTIIILLFFPTFVFAFDCDKNGGPYSYEYNINSKSSPDFVQNGAMEIQASSNGPLDSVNIIICTPKDKKLLSGFAFPDTLLTCYSASQTTFDSRLILLFNSGFRISQIVTSGSKVFYYIEKK